MLKLSKIVKSYKETGSLNENVSVFGFLDDQVFLTKGGDVGVVMRVEGVDYECLDHKQTDESDKAPGIGSPALGAAVPRLPVPVQVQRRNDSSWRIRQPGRKAGG